MIELSKEFKQAIEQTWYAEKLKQIPAADVVEVVRCKDCINWNGNDCITIYGLNAPRPNDYCSRGERNRDEKQSKEGG